MTRPAIDPLHMTHRPMDPRRRYMIEQHIGRQSPGQRKHIHGDIQPMAYASARQFSDTVTRLALALVAGWRLTWGG